MNLNNILQRIPPQLRFLALGGATRAFSDLAMPVTERSDLVVESTYLSSEVKQGLVQALPNAMHIDFMEDDLDRLDHAMELAELRSRYSSFLPTALACSNRYLRTPLHESCVSADAKRCLWLLKHGAMTDQKDAKGHTSLHIAAERKLAIVRLRDALRRDCPEDINSLTGFDECTKHLVDFGASCLITNQATESPLYVACIRRNAPGLTTMLLRLSSAVKEGGIIPDIACPDSKKYTSLHAAIIGRNEECCHLILDYYEKHFSCSTYSRFVNSKTQMGAIALDLARRYTLDSRLIQRLSAATESPSSSDSFAARSVGADASGDLSSSQRNRRRTRRRNQKCT